MDDDIQFLDEYIALLDRDIAEASQRIATVERNGASRLRLYRHRLRQDKQAVERERSWLTWEQDSFRFGFKLERNPELYRWRECGRCYWCGKIVDYKAAENAPNRATREHLKPKAAPHYGENTRDNIVVACYACNQKRGFNVQWDAPPLVEEAG